MHSEIRIDNEILTIENSRHATKLVSTNSIEIEMRKMIRRNGFLHYQLHETPFYW